MVISQRFYRAIVTVHAVCAFFIFSCWGAKKPEPVHLKTMTEVLAALDACKVKTIKGKSTFNRTDLTKIAPIIQQALTDTVITKETVNTRDMNGNTVLHLIFGVNYEVPYVNLPIANCIYPPSVVLYSIVNEPRTVWGAIKGDTAEAVKTLKPLLERLLELQANVVIRNNYPIKNKFNNNESADGRGYSPYLLLRLIHSVPNLFETPSEENKLHKMAALQNIEKLLNIFKTAVLAQAQAGDQDAIEQWLIDFQKSNYLWGWVQPIVNLGLNSSNIDQNPFVIRFKNRLGILGKVLGLEEPSVEKVPVLVIPELPAFTVLTEQCAAEKKDLEQLTVDFGQLNDYGVVAIRTVLQQYVTNNGLSWLAFLGQAEWKTYFDMVKKKFDDAFPAAQQRLLAKALESALYARDFTEFQEIFTELSGLCGSDAKASNLLDATKKPFLYTAVSCGFVQAVTFLLDKGADATMTFKGIAPLKMAQYLRKNTNNTYKTEQLQDFDAIITALSTAIDTKKPEEGAAVTLSKALKVLQEKLSALALGLMGKNKTGT